MNNQSNQTSIVTGKVRLSFVHLFTPYAHQVGAEPKYSTTILIPKTDIATKQRIDAAIAAAIQQGVTGKWNGTRPPQVKNPVWDGDGVRQNGEPFGTECKGHWVLTASSNQQQEIIDINMNPIINQTEVYSGMYARVSTNFFPYFNSGNKGVGCGLGPVQKLEDGKPLGGRISAASAFGDAPVPGGYTPPAAPQTQYQQPAQSYPPQNYNQSQVQQGYPQQVPPPAYQTPQQAVQIDPITGRPINGGVMGI
ncbi:DUF2815 family protein [Clostridium pasteurianum]|uniref:DUF2815 family protein n=1 Tax=Clostridium pasteurianum BC1 TaxID=86416 RepID=R4JZ81_CLOPA|nr:DUF2815 family protein [Clostridium pasteurianum]AGK95608.1 Protein of unknown function (DUF2815) [Clostridium pasteurianum BC1]